MNQIATTILVTGFLLEALALFIECSNWRDVYTTSDWVTHFTISKKARAKAKFFALTGVIVIVVSFYFYIWN